MTWRSFLSVLASRGEMPDPVAAHAAVAIAALWPDALPDPGWCVCRECQPDLYEENR